MYSLLGPQLQSQRVAPLEELGLRGSDQRRDVQRYTGGSRN